MSHYPMKLIPTPNKIFIEPDPQLTKISNKLIINRSNLKISETQQVTEQGFQPKKIYGIIGVYEINGKSIIIYIEQAKIIGNIEGFAIYKIIQIGAIDKVIIQIKKKYSETEYELYEKDQIEKLKKLFNNCFYFSYGLDLTNQQLFQSNKFWWNYQLCKIFPLDWQLKIIQGYVGMFNTYILNKQLQYILISRRSYYKGGSIRNDTGIDQDGNVANFTETEQIIYYEKEKVNQILCSGSIPLFWQYNILNNSIQISQEDPKKSLNKHFQQLLMNYIKIHFINLIDDGSQLSILLNRYIIENEHLSYHKINFREIFLNKDTKIINNFIDQLYDLIDFSCINKRQQTIMRLNCYDCLDSTSIIMSKLAILGIQKIFTYFKIDIKQIFNSNNLSIDLDIPSIHKMHPFLMNFKLRWSENVDNLRLVYKVGQQNCDLNQFYKNMIEEKQLQEVIYRVIGLNSTDSQANENIKTLENTMKIRENEYTKLLQKNVYVITWNINAHQPQNEEMYNQLFQFTTLPHIVAIGFQELVQLNTLTVVGRQKREIVDVWKQILSNCLNSKAKYILAAQQVMVGTYVIVFVLDEEKHHISNIKTDVVKYGFGQQLGNKGGVIVKLRFYDSNICFINVHLPAGQKCNDDRISAFDYIHNKAELNKCDWVITFGDMNFRINLQYQFVVQNIQKYQQITIQEQKEAILKNLKENDQLYLEKQKSQYLKQFQEYDIQFLPTYKYDLGTEIYDTIKKRVPSFTDRILLKKIQKIQVHQVEWYDRLKGNFQVSDHRPVGCLINTQICEIDQKKKEQLFRELIKMDEQLDISNQYFPKIKVVKQFEHSTKYIERNYQIENLQLDEQYLNKLCNPLN